MVVRTNLEEQVHDIVGPAAVLKKEIDGLPGIKLVEIPGDNHQYKDFKLLARHIKRSCKKILPLIALSPGPMRINAIA